MKKHTPASLRTKVIIFISLILVAGFFSISTTSYHVAKKSLRNSIINNSLPLTRDNIISEINRDIMKPVYASSLMAHDTFMKDWAIHNEDSQDHIVKYLSEIKDKYGFYAAFFVSEKTKKYYYYKGVLKTISEGNEQDDWYYNFIKSGAPYEINIDPNEAENFDMTVFINHRVYDYDENLIGVAGVGLKLSRISNLLSTYQVKYERDVYMVDRKGIVQVHPDRSLIYKADINKTPGINSIAYEILTANTFAENFEFKRGESTILVTSRYIPELDWFLIVEHNQTASMREIKKTLITNLIWGVLISVLIIFTNIAVINHYQKKLERLATTDELTGCFNRRHMHCLFDRAKYAFERHKEDFSIILFDIDKFKTLNDTLGHTKGDEIIRRVVEISSNNIRKEDYLIRWGGDEFLIITKGTNKDAFGVAERVRTGICDDQMLSELASGKKHKFDVSISCGISQFIENDSVEALVARADKALYDAKRNGRNMSLVLNDKIQEV